MKTYADYSASYMRALALKEWAKFWIAMGFTVLLLIGLFLIIISNMAVQA